MPLLASASPIVFVVFKTSSIAKSVGSNFIGVQSHRNIHSTFPQTYRAPHSFSTSHNYLAQTALGYLFLAKVSFPFIINITLFFFHIINSLRKKTHPSLRKQVAYIPLQ